MEKRYVTRGQNHLRGAHDALLHFPPVISFHHRARDPLRRAAAANLAAALTCWKLLRRLQLASSITFTSSLIFIHSLSRVAVHFVSCNLLSSFLPQAPSLHPGLTVRYLGAYSSLLSHHSSDSKASPSIPLSWLSEDDTA